MHQDIDPSVITRTVTEVKFYNNKTVYKTIDPNEETDIVSTSEFFGKRGDNMTEKEQDKIELL
jgi:hypothetical protein